MLFGGLASAGAAVSDTTMHAVKRRNGRAEFVSVFFMLVDLSRPRCTRRHRGTPWSTSPPQ